MTLFVAMNFFILPQQLLEPLSVCTPGGESNKAKRVFHDTICVHQNNTMDSLVELDLVYFK